MFGFVMHDLSLWVNCYRVPFFIPLFLLCFLSGKRPNSIIHRDIKQKELKTSSSSALSVSVSCSPSVKADNTMVDKLFNVHRHFSTWHFFQSTRVKQSSTLISTYLLPSPSLCHIRCDICTSFIFSSYPNTSHNSGFSAGLLIHS